MQFAHSIQPAGQIMTKAILCVVFTSMLIPATVSAEKIPDQYKIGSFALGCQAYTSNRVSGFEAIEKTAEAGRRVIDFLPGHELRAGHAEVEWCHTAPHDVFEQV